MLGRIATALLTVTVCSTGVLGGDEDSVRLSKFEGVVDAQVITTRVDHHLARLWKQSDIEPAAVASDSEFLRRASLDLTGVVPSAAQSRDFLESQDPNKRSQWIEELMLSPRHATHLANTWRNIILPDGFALEMGNSAAGMQSWLRGRFAQNMRYDRIVGEFLTATGGSETGPALYYQALESKPEKLAASTARIFLGLRLECAQCHDHPFDAWRQEDFWEYAAFFARVDGQNQGGRFRLSDRKGGEVTLPEEATVVLPEFPSGEAPPDDADGNRRLQLSIWMSSANNPFLAKAAVNRVWSLLFGKGLVNPVDDLDPQNAPVDAELLEDLADLFVQSGFNLQELIRGLGGTDAYQRTSRGEAGVDGRRRRELFAQMNAKALTAEQLFDSIQQSLHLAGQAPASSNVVADRTRQVFVSQIDSKTTDATEYGSGIQQTLSLMNGAQVATGTAGARGLLAALHAPFLSDSQRIDTIFLATLSRFPTPPEQEAIAVLTSQGAAEAVRSDLLWAILNSAEFRFNH